MLFNSLEFLVFFGIVYLLYVNLSHTWQNRLLLVASCVFYGSWDWRFLGLIALSTALDYYAGQCIEDAKEAQGKKRWLIVSVVSNLGILGFFKYYNFFVENLEALIGRFGLDAGWMHLDVVLPVGISFYTFQTMSYTIDIYRGKLKACRSFWDFALFVTFFPQLVAGPIARAADLLPQVSRPRSITPEQLESGVFLILWGFFKKVIIADGCAYVVNAVFAGDAVHTGLDKLLAVYAFAFQIYGDFSGYSDIARGLMKVMGFELMLNFDLPYFATNPSEFWRRWHISLSSWLRDYLYIPLGGSRGSSFLTYRNLFLTMLLGGIWHGASWTMVLWGVYQGMALIIHRLLTGDRARRREHERAAWVRALQILFMFQVTCLGWLIFRAESVSQIGDFLVSLVTGFRPSVVTLSYAKLVFGLAAPLMVFQWWQYRRGDLEIFTRWTAPKRAAFLMALVWVAGAYFTLHRSLVQGEIPFIYFQF